MKPQSPQPWRMWLITTRLAMAHHNSVQVENPNISHAEAFTKAAGLWKVASEPEKAKYQAEADAVKAAYLEQKAAAAEAAAEVAETKPAVKKTAAKKTAAKVVVKVCRTAYAPGHLPHTLNIHLPTHMAVQLTLLHAHGSIWICLPAPSQMLCASRASCVTFPDSLFLEVGTIQPPLCLPSRDLTSTSCCRPGPRSRPLPRPPPRPPPKPPPRPPLRLPSLLAPRALHLSRQQSPPLLLPPQPAPLHHPRLPAQGRPPAALPRATTEPSSHSCSPSLPHMHGPRAPLSMLEYPAHMWGSVHVHTL